MQLQASAFAGIYKLNRLVVTLRNLAGLKHSQKPVKFCHREDETQKYSLAGFTAIYRQQ